MTEDTQTRLVIAARAASQEFSNKTPQERYAWLVARGLITNDGQVTTNAGGDAAPETPTTIPTGR